MQTGSFLEGIKTFLRKENNLQLVIAGVVAVALLVTVYATTFSSSNNAAPQSSAEVETKQDSQSMESRLESILSHVQGAGNVRVLVSYATGPQIVPAMSVDTQRNTTDGGTAGAESHSVSTTENSEPVVVQGKNGSEPMVLTEKEPEVLGVLVVAEGASKLEVRLRLAAAVQVALQLPADRIEVLPMVISNLKEGS